MNKNTKIVLTLLALGLVLSCKERVEEETPDYSENAGTGGISAAVHHGRGGDSGFRAPESGWRCAGALFRI